MATKIKLNEIEGFDPSEYLRDIVNADGTQSKYLDVAYRKLWFRLCNPNGKIVKAIQFLDDNKAVVEARIYLDRNDSPENYVSNAFAQRCRDEKDDYGSHYLETAETAAVGRALADAGYGMQFCIEPDTTPADSGVRIPSATPVTIAEPTSRCSGKAVVEDVAEETTPQPSQQSHSQNPSPVMTLNQALNYVIKGGKHNGKTVGQLVVEDPSYFDWMLNKYKGNDPKLKEAVDFVAANR